jgi:hypothetical protein
MGESHADGEGSGAEQWGSDHQGHRVTQVVLALEEGGDRQGRRERGQSPAETRDYNLVKM